MASSVSQAERGDQSYRQAAASLPHPGAFPSGRVVGCAALAVGLPDGDGGTQDVQRLAGQNGQRLARGVWGWGRHLSTYLELEKA